MKKIFIDIETDFANANDKKLLSVGICDNYRKIEKEWFFHQNKDNLFYPANVDTKYLQILQTWEKSPKTRLADFHKEFSELTNDSLIIGWNISRFDIPILNRMFNRILKIDWKPTIFDACWALSDIVQDNRKLNELPLTKTGKKSVSFEGVFKVVTGCKGYREWHSALFDAQDERHIFSVLCKRYPKYFDEGKIRTFSPKTAYAV